METSQGRFVKIFNRNFFLGVGAGMVITILIPMAGESPFKARYSGENLPGGGKAREGGLEASPLPSAALADYDWIVQSLDGPDFKMTDAKGKVVFLNFWATWCSPCVAEMASIQRLYEKLRDRGVVFACISNEKASKVSRFVRRKGFTLPIYTMRGSPPAVFDNQRVPATFILSRDGRIALKHIGSAKWDDDKTVDFIKRLTE
jgi:thiol-disulfide isomerase/thioredoxin